MAGLRCAWLLPLLIISVQLNGVLISAASASDALKELVQLRSKTKDSVIRATDDQLRKWAGNKGRDFSLIVFLDAEQVKDNPQLAMAKVRAEFGLVAKALQAGPNPDSAFFLDMVFEHSPRVFQAVKAQQVPFIFHIPGDRKYSQQDFPVEASQRMMVNQVQGKYPWSAETMVDFFAKLTGLEFAEVDRPSLLKSPLFLPVVALTLLMSLFGVYQMWQLGVLHSPILWAAASIIVVWHSMSGGMYNIIRNIPFYILNREGKPQFFTPSRQGQLGAEGFIMGSGYFAFSAAISLLTFGVPSIRNSKLRGLCSFVCLGVAAFLFAMITKAYHVKTGYTISSYLL